MSRPSSLIQKLLLLMASEDHAMLMLILVLLLRTMVCLYDYTCLPSDDQALK